VLVGRWAEGERHWGASGRGHGPESAQPGGKGFPFFLFFFLIPFSPLYKYIYLFIHDIF
jgi:hypothetical protein